MAEQPHHAIQLLVKSLREHPERWQVTHPGIEDVWTISTTTLVTPRDSRLGMSNKRLVVVVIHIEEAADLFKKAECVLKVDNIESTLQAADRLFLGDACEKFIRHYLQHRRCEAVFLMLENSDLVQR